MTEKFVEDETLALVFLREKLFLYIPKRALPPEAFTRLRTLITTSRS